MISECRIALLFSFVGPLETDPIVAMAVTAKDRERRAALLADSPDLSRRPPPTSGGGGSSSSSLSRKLAAGCGSVADQTSEAGDGDSDAAVSINSSTGFPKEPGTVASPWPSAAGDGRTGCITGCCCPNQSKKVALSRITSG